MDTIDQITGYHAHVAVFSDAQTKLRKPANLKALTAAIDKLEHIPIAWNRCL